MLIHSFVPASRANGPGLRAVVYVQGCSLNCRGCWNAETHALVGTEQAPEQVAQTIIAGASALDGVTFSGGEPMQQAHDLLITLQTIRAAAPELSIGIYSGYSHHELAVGRFETRQSADQIRRARLWQEIRSDLDFAVLGRYVESRPGNLPLRSSTNQDLQLFSGRYSTADFAPLEVEVQIGSEGVVQITGFPLLGIPA